ncbi:alpha-amylase family protein [Cupriavidus cauae]|uniref:alpha-amylase family protein n=1 Tax=Cupriavidus TaxID=106589 RepID=UPI0011F005A0|nr:MULTISPECIES: alpha-amylase family protein [Cupriavidus]KAA0182328.1 glycosidase [Cupriavidus gilardii]MCA7084305.1 alpha-amylase family protein [Cupriavidus sp. DB3]UZN48994.1 alpha-amylase family protein [Cupriavidus cauae]
MRSLWYRNAIIYQIDVSVFRDGNNDGWGDLQGLTAHLEYLRGLGVTCIWLSPFYQSPFRDGGYDVTDHLAVDPRFGDLADMVALLEKAEELGIRVMVELVAHHTSDQHRWFQEARRDRNSPYRDYYVWADEPEETHVKPIFPTVEDSVWTWDEEAGQYYRHAFYSHQPDLNIANPAVRAEIEDIMSFWLRLGVSGFRIDAAGHMIDGAKEADPRDDGFWLLNDLRAFATLRRSDAVLLGEVDVPAEDYARYFGKGHRLTLVSNFFLNNFLFLALARERAEPIERALREQPDPPERAQYAVWVRNHDELDLERLSEAEREEVMQRFAPDEDMRVYNRGIRRRLPPMLDGDQRRIAQVHALLFSLPGTPILRYGEEIGMGEDLSQKERHAVRTAMQWSDEVNGGFSPADPDSLPVPVIREGPFAYDKVNIYEQTLRDDSLLARTGKMIRARLGMPEIGYGECTVMDVGCPAVLALRHELDGQVVFTFANLSGQDVEVGLPDVEVGELRDMLVDGPYPPQQNGAHALKLRAYGYRWLRQRPCFAP